MPNVRFFSYQIIFDYFFFEYTESSFYMVFFYPVPKQHDSSKKNRLFFRRFFSLQHGKIKRALNVLETLNLGFISNYVLCQSL